MYFNCCIFKNQKLKLIVIQRFELQHGKEIQNKVRLSNKDCTDNFPKKYGGQELNGK